MMDDLSLQAAACQQIEDMGGTVVRVEDEVIVYRCPHCGGLHRVVAIVHLIRVGEETERKQKQTAIPDAFHETIRKALEGGV